MNYLLVGVGGLVAVPALDDNVHDILVDMVGSRFTSNNADAKVRGIETSLDSLVKSEAHGSLHTRILGVKLWLFTKSLASQRSMLGGNIRKVTDGIDGSLSAPRDAKIALDVLHTLELQIESSKESDG